MNKGTRYLSLDVCDYNNEIVCNLYNSSSNVSGQAADIYVRSERNGWKELSFKLPTTCSGEQGEEPNFRMDYLIADYRLRLRSNNDLDYYLISEPRIIHNGKEKNLEVTAGHISQLLKTKNLGLEFSDEEGNNTGTARELLTTILDGTSWNVGEVAFFAEDDDPEKEKVRSITAETKTGAFALISKLCEKFDAKPIYNGAERTVTLVPMNPFSEVEGSQVPQEVLDGAPALELNYGNNVTSITRTLNTENLVTRLYAYGAYGSKVTGLCSLQNAKHSEYTITVEGNYPAGQEFSFVDGHGDTHYFTSTTGLFIGDMLIWSDLDQTSRSYVYNGYDENNPIIYETYYNPKDYSTVVVLNAEPELVDNKFDYLTNFSYYDKIGLLTDQMKLDLAIFQRTMPAVIDVSTEASKNLTEKELELSRIAESNTGFLRFDVSEYETGTDGALRLMLNKTEECPDGVMYRSDYDEARRNYFSWYCAEALKDNGEPTTGIGSVVYIIHNTSPVTWEKAYVKEIDGSTEAMDYSMYSATDPDSITLWISRSNVPALAEGDRFYLFSTNSISGRLGVRESELEAVQGTLQQATKVVTEEHPTYFVWNNDPAPDLSVVEQSYGWYYRSFSGSSNPGELWFCYGLAGDDHWHRAIIAETDPDYIDHGYYFNLKTKRLYHGENLKWVYVADSGISINASTTYYAPNAEAKRLSQSFSKVAYYCLRHDMLYKGIYDEYIYDVEDNDLPVGNYAFKSDYGFYWVFSTDQKISHKTGEETENSRAGTIWLDTVKYQVYQTEDIGSVVKPEAKPYESIDFPAENELSEATILDGSISEYTGVEENSTTKKRTNHITAYGGVTYEYYLPVGSFVSYYDSNRRHLGCEELTGEIDLVNSFTTPIRTKYIRFVFSSMPDTENYYVRVQDHQNKLFIKETEYTILSPLRPAGNKAGITDLIQLFADTADECYTTYLKEFQAAQETIKTKDNALKDELKDLYREGYWQNNDYIESDSQKLYDDAIDNLEKIAKPEATYDVQFLDLYAANNGMGYTTDESLDEIEWPDLDTSYAIHLIDDEIDVNCWAFIDTLNKCYDKPQNTEITINTDLSLIAQHSFTDVMTRIAEVANVVSNKKTIYDRASVITGTKAFTTNKLEGTIKANQNLFDGGKSNWYTNSDGNFVFESADGQSAMMLTGYGFCVANTKNADGDWVFKTFGTGNGFSADEITTGEMSAVHLIAGTITTDLMHASVGQELEIGSNKALMLYATVDGYRPSGGLKTKVDNGDGTYSDIGEGDSYIEIAAAKPSAESSDDRPAHINIRTGGILNLSGSQMNLETVGTNKGVMNLKSGEMNIESAGKLNINGGEINIDSAGTLNIEGGTITIDAHYTYDEYGRKVPSKAGTVNLTAESDIKMASGGTFTLGSNNVIIDKTGNALFKGTLIAWAGNIAGFTIGGDVARQPTPSTLLSAVSDPNEGTKEYEDDNKPVGRPSDNYRYTRQYIYAGTNSIDSTLPGIYIGTDGLNIGGKFKYNKDSKQLTVRADKVFIGNSAASITLDGTSSGLLNLTANGSINISSGNTMSIVTDGILAVGDKNYPFYICSKNGVSYIANNTNGATVYLGTDMIALGSYFKVTSDGKLYAKDVAGAYGTMYASDGRIGATISGDGDSRTATGGWNIGENQIYSENKKVGLNAKATNADNSVAVAIWAGDATAGSAPFFVKHDGYMKSSSGTIGGWSIGTNMLSSTSGDVGMYSLANSNDSKYKIENNVIAFWAGGATPKNAPFYVTHGGALHATSATISGTVTAGDGSSIGGWYIAEDRIRSGNATSGGKTGMANPATPNDDNIVFWAGTTTKASGSNILDPAQSPFYVKEDGSIYATKGWIGSFQFTSETVTETGEDGKSTKYTFTGLTSETVNSHYMTLSPFGVAFFNNNQQYSHVNSAGATFNNLNITGKLNGYTIDDWVASVTVNSNSQTNPGVLIKSAQGTNSLRIYQEDGNLVFDTGTNTAKFVFSGGSSTTYPNANGQSF